MLVCSPACDSGINSSTTTYTIAPAAKDNIYGRIGITAWVNAIAITADIGSTIPERVPYKKALPLEIPSAFKGIDIIAPSGKFCMAIPTASTIAPAIVILAFPIKAPANTTPVAIPSGILWIVTANTNFVVFLKFDSNPSAFSVSKCWCGTSVSKINKNTIPDIKPTATGTHANFPAVISNAGINNDHIDAAIITPAAKPINNFWTFLFISFFLIKNTNPEPNVVPRNGISTPIITLPIMSSSTF